MKFIVCGTGPSIEGWKPPEGYTTIGVHDIGKHFTPDHLLVFDQYHKFRPERRATILGTEPHDTLWVRDMADWKELVRRHNHKTFISTKCKDVWELTITLKVTRLNTGSTVLPHFRSSVYTACSLAYKLGATWIGLIGVDITGHPALMRHLDALNCGFGKLREALENLGTELVNLSRESYLFSIPYHEPA